MTSTENREPQGSASSSTEHHRCTCGHERSAHSYGSGCIGNRNLCGCQGFVCDHSRCGWEPPHQYAGPDHCQRCAKWWEDQLAGLKMIPRPEPEEPPLTPEEEEQAPEDPACTCGSTACESELCDCDSAPCPVDHASEVLRPPEGPEYTPCLNCGHIEPEHDLLTKRCQVGNEETSCGCDGYRIEQPPPQPERRPPLLVSYSVAGHLYEVALSGDATVSAVDGALVIKHPLGFVAGITGVAPLTSKEST